MSCRISLYILRAHVGPFIFGACTVMFVFLLNFLINYLPQLVGKGLGAWIITQLIALNLAWMVTLAVPLGVLMATLMAFGNLGATNEITIIKSSGGALRMMVPVLIVAAALSVWLFWFNDAVLPDANFRAQMLMIDIQRKKPTFIVDKGQFSTQIEGYSILARDIDTARGMLLGVTIYDNSSVDAFRVLSADSGQINFSTDYAKLVVTLSNGEIHYVQQQNFGDYKRIAFERHRVIMDAQGFEFSRSDERFFSRGDRTMRIDDMRTIVGDSRKSAEMSAKNIEKTMDLHFRYAFGLGDKASPEPRPQAIAPDTTPRKIPTLKEAAWRVESKISGVYASLDNDMYQIRDRQLTANKYLVEIHKKYVIPVACLVFALVGCPLGIIVKRGNFGVSGAITLGFYVVYWIFLISGERLADRGVIEPWIAMWASDISLTALGLFLIWRVSHDKPIISFPSSSAFGRFWRALSARTFRRGE